MKRVSYAIIFVLVGVVLFSVVSVRASSGLIALAPGVGVGLPFYDTVLDATANLYFTQLTWDDTDATTATFSGVRMGSGSSFATLGVSSDVNVTFTTVNAGSLGYLVGDVGSQNFTGVQQPVTVTIDGTATTENWTYSSHVLSVENAVSTVEVTFATGLTVDDAIAIAVVCMVVAICVAVVFMKARKNEG